MHIWLHVRIGVKGEGRGGIAEHLGDGPRVHCLRKEPARSGVRRTSGLVARFGTHPNLRQAVRPADTKLPLAYEEAGATWRPESIHGMRGSLDEMVARVRSGPPG